MGLMQREKGKRHERRIAARLRVHWPDAVVRRSSQAERADNPDVFIESRAEVLQALWLELQDARTPTPMIKLTQAEHDIVEWLKRRPGVAVNRLPVVIWHKLGERIDHVTTRLWVIDELRGVSTTNMEAVTMALVQFEGLLISATQTKEAA